MDNNVYVNSDIDSNIDSNIDSDTEVKEKNKQIKWIWFIVSIIFAIVISLLLKYMIIPRISKYFENKTIVNKPN